MRVLLSTVSLACTSASRAIRRPAESIVWPRAAHKRVEIVAIPARIGIPCLIPRAVITDCHQKRATLSSWQQHLPLLKSDAQTMMHEPGAPVIKARARSTKRQSMTSALTGRRWPQNLAEPFYSY
ncbi:hypothetical protein PsYK624_063190 [Phanerochaete sordida]|uniref:Uncharacterized protein n=1 Tax=Phanerochaete sordida TaxID=48140 RepID=A0A9P3LDC3_9APHY|nr:hypothetical protein PsYK624_063190 [Phanerochaete sordida]